MEIRTETVYVARMTRLEAARTLVDPKELLQALRARLGSNGSEDEIIEGQAVTRALPAGETKPSTHVKRAMKKLGKASKRVACPHCDNKFLPRGLNKHIGNAHPDAAREGTA